MQDVHQKQYFLARAVIQQLAGKREWVPRLIGRWSFLMQLPRLLRYSRMLWIIRQKAIHFAFHLAIQLILSSRFFYRKTVHDNQHEYDRNK